MNREDLPSLAGGNDQPIAELLSQTVQTGLPIESGLRALAEQTRSRSTRNKLISISNQIEAGVPLAEALSAAKSGLPHQLSALVEAGIESGRLDTVMQFWIGQTSRSQSMRQQIWLSLSYPIFLAWFATVVCAAILLFIIPSFASIFVDFGLMLPALTEVFMHISTFLFRWGWVPWVLASLFGIGFWIVLIGIGMTAWGQRRLTSIPVIGQAFHCAALSDFCQILAILIDARLTLPRALYFAGNANDDRWLNRQCQKVIKSIEEGHSAENSARYIGLPNSLSQAFRQSGSAEVLSSSLRALAEVFAAQSQVSIQVATILVGRMTVLFVVSFATMTAVALFVPVIKLLNDLS